MLTVHLHKLLFNGFHGIHDEERILGNEYEVNCDVEFHENVDVIMHIDDTINYVTIDQIIRRRMAIPTPLLETVIMEIGNEIHTPFPNPEVNQNFHKKITCAYQRHPGISRRHLAKAFLRLLNCFSTKLLYILTYWFTLFYKVIEH